MCLDNFNVSSKKTAIETKYREILRQMENRIWARVRNQERNQPPVAKMLKKYQENQVHYSPLDRDLSCDGIIIHLLKGSTACFAKSEPGRNFVADAQREWNSLTDILITSNINESKLY